MKILLLDKMDKRIQNLAMKDTIRNSMIALPIIGIFEIVMIIRWLFLHSSNVSDYSRSNFYGYIFLLTTTIITFSYVIWMKQDIENRCLGAKHFQTLYGIAILVWAVWMTFVPAYYKSEFEYLIYVTIVTIVPVFCFIPPIQWTIMQLCSAAAVLYLANIATRFDAFLINFSVFSFISIIASFSSFHIRYDSYKKQVALEDERNINDKFAHYDVLTGLLNRRSYLEKAALISEKKDDPNLVLLVFDANGLKKANDTLGHDAGDELLIGVAQCITEAFSNFGSLYRVGGDEFSGLISATQEELENAISNFEKISSEWKGTFINGVSIAIGYASMRDYPNATIDELEVIADDFMYENKKKYYENNK